MLTSAGAAGLVTLTVLTVRLPVRPAQRIEAFVSPTASAMPPLSADAGEQPGLRYVHRAEDAWIVASGAIAVERREVNRLQASDTGSKVAAGGCGGPPAARA